MENCKPIVGVRGMNRGGKVYQVINYSTVWVLLKKKKEKKRKEKKPFILVLRYLARKSYFAWSSEPREGLAACSTNRVSSFLSYFKTMGIGRASGIEPATFPLCSQATAARLS